MEMDRLEGGRRSSHLKPMGVFFFRKFPKSRRKSHAYFPIGKWIIAISLLLQGEILDNLREFLLGH